ncbi:MAG TPA: class E sortase, partial [Methylococcales bacterium]
SVRQNLTKQVHQKTSTTKATTPQPKVNSLLVPSMLLDTPVLEGSLNGRYKTLDHGIWRWPLGSTPDKGGNTVLIGHRFTYTNPRGVLYFLDKVQVQDEIGVVWNGTNYTYRVTSIREVPPTETSIQDATSDAQLTIFTCTPLWQPKDRLVVVAKLEGA